MLERNNNGNHVAFGSGVTVMNDVADHLLRWLLLRLRRLMEPQQLRLHQTERSSRCDI